MQFLRQSQLKSVHTLLLAIATLTMLAGAGNPIGSWPPYLSKDGDTVWFEKPSLESWDYLRARIAVSVQLKLGETQARRGRAVLEARTFADRAEQRLTLRNFRVLELSFPGTAQGDEATARASFEKLIVGFVSQADLNDVVAAVAPAKELFPIDISREVPKIFVATKPAVLLQFDGPPMWLPIDGSKLSYGVNTNWDIFYDNKSTFYYLLAGDTWLATHDPYSNEWVLPRSLPKELKQIPHTPDFANVWKHLPYEVNFDLPVPQVLYTEHASELIVIDGEPVLEPIGSLPISVVTNTKSDLFFHKGTGRYYFLVAGRWFDVADLSAFWRSAVDLPAEFAAIPSDHPAGRILAHVPGTRQAREEAVWSQVPQLAKVRRAAAKVKVEFAGKPRFVPIDGTNLLWVPNATVPIIVEGRTLYACHHAVWFRADSPEGPWEVADRLPADLYRIPSRSPVFHLSFVRLVESDSETVTFGYTGGYEGLFVHDGVVVYGSGFEHAPALQYGAYTYPVYFAQPATFGAGAWYDPERHVFLRGRPGYGPFGGFGATSRYNSVTSHYFRAQTLYGDEVGDKPSLAFLPYTASYGKLTAVFDPYATWGDAIVNNGRAAPAAAQNTVTIEVGTPVVGSPDGGASTLPKSPNAFRDPGARP